MAHLFGIDLSTLTGAAAAGEVSIPDQVANRFVADQLARSAGSAVSGLSIEAEEHDTLTIRMSLRGLEVHTRRGALVIAYGLSMLDA